MLTEKEESFLQNRGKNFLYLAALSRNSGNGVERRFIESFYSFGAQYDNPGGIRPDIPPSEMKQSKKSAKFALYECYQNSITILNSSLENRPMQRKFFSEHDLLLSGEAFSSSEIKLAHQIYHAKADKKFNCCCCLL